jgi:TPR repeat protein
MATAFRHPVLSLVVALWALTSSAPARAGQFEDAQAALAAGNHVTALELLGKLVDQDNPEAEHLLAVMYLRGLGVPQDDAMAVRWLKIAAAHGQAEAQNQLGLFYAQGRGGIERNIAEAVKLFRLAADQGGLAAAQNNLADSLMFGLGGKQDLKEAFKWYRIAADQGSAYAENVIGVAYERGFFVAQDEAEAFRWYRRAANKIIDRPGSNWIHSPQYNIALMYASGRGTAQDNVRALMWFTLATAFGDTKPPAEGGVKLVNTPTLTAPEQREKLLPQMTASQIAEGERMAREWQPHPVLTIESTSK